MIGTLPHHGSRQLQSPLGRAPDIDQLQGSSLVRFRSLLVVLLGGNAIITVANLLRDVALASTFGAGMEADILFLAMSVPLFLISVAANAFRSVTVPALSKAMAEGLDDARAMTRRFLAIATTGAFATSAALGIAAILLYFAEFLPLEVATRQRFALFLAAITPMYFLAGLVEIWQGPAQAWNRFLAPSLLRLGLPCGIALACMVAPSATLETVAIGGAIGTGVAAVAGLGLLQGLGIGPARPAPPLPREVAITAKANFTALVAATCITYANPLVDQWIAGLTGPGGVSMLGYAGRLTTGILGLVAAALSQALLVHYSRHVGSGNSDGIKSTYRLLLQLAPWLGCLATLAVWLTSDLAIQLLYERGSFDADTTQGVARLVDLYAIQFPIYWTATAAFTLIWATSMNRVFLRIGIVLFGVNAACDLLFAKLFGINGIALTTSVVYALSGLLLHRALRSAGLVSISGRDIAGLAAPLALLAACWWLIGRLELGFSPGQPLTSTLLSAGLLVAFAALAAASALRTLSLGKHNLLASLNQ